MDTTRATDLTDPTPATARESSRPSSARADGHASDRPPRDRRTGTGDVVTVQGLVCRYGAFTAVRGIDLSVRAGELFALLGTNGAGKTTTLETLEGHRRPDAGTLRVLGRDPHRERRSLAGRCGVVFQRSGLPGELTPRELLRLWIELTPGATRHLDVDGTLERVELSHRRDVRISRLSGGEQRRLDLAVALLNDPQLVFLDEPTTGMDPEARRRTWSLLRDLVAGGVTVVLTTHYLEEAEALADRLAILHEGQVAVSGTVADVVAAHPARIQARLPRGAPEPGPVGDACHLDSEGRLTVATNQLQRDLTWLLRWAEDHEVALDGLEATDASLAEVFHGIAGGADAEAAAGEDRPSPADATFGDPEVDR